METQALRRLEKDVGKLLVKYRHAAERQAQLSAALGKSRDEIEKLRAELQRYKSERTDTRKKVDALLKRFEKLDIDWEHAES